MTPKTSALIADLNARANRLAMRTPAPDTLAARPTGLKSPAIGPLTPRDAPFVDGQRYSLAGSADSAGLDLFSLDPNGDFVRRFGVLVLFAQK